MPRSVVVTSARPSVTTKLPFFERRPPRAPSRARSAIHRLHLGVRRHSRCAEPREKRSRLLRRLAIALPPGQHLGPLRFRTRLPTGTPIRERVRERQPGGQEVGVHAERLADETLALACIAAEHSRK